MGLPHSGQVGVGPSAAMCLALHLRRAAPFWYRPEPALLLMFPSCVFGGLGGIRIRDPVAVFAGCRAIPAWPVGSLPYVSRGGLTGAGVLDAAGGVLSAHGIRGI